LRKLLICWFVCWFVCRGRVCWCWVSWGSIGWCGVSWLVGRCGVSWLVGWCGVSWGLVSTFVLDDGVETVVVVSGVFNGTGGTVGFQKAVRSFDVTVAVAVFGLALDVVCGWVVYAVFKVVWGWGICGFWSVSLWCRVSWCRVSGLVSWGGVLGEGRSHASGEDDQLKQNTKVVLFFRIYQMVVLSDVISFWFYGLVKEPLLILKLRLIKRYNITRIESAIVTLNIRVYIEEKKMELILNIINRNEQKIFNSYITEISLLK